MNGWIKLHRKLMDKAYYKKPAYLLVWIHLLLTANHAPKEFMWNGKIILVKEGQLITGRKELSVQLDVPETTIERILNLLESEHQIEQTKTTKYRLITIVNWHQYQNSDSTLDNKRTTSGQQADTNKNDKNDKKEKNIYGEFGNVLLTEAEYLSLIEKLNQQAVDNLIGELDEYIESKGVKYRSHYATIQSWARRRIQEHRAVISNQKPKMI